MFKANIAHTNKLFGKNNTNSHNPRAYCINQVCFEYKKNKLERTNNNRSYMKYKYFKIHFILI